MTMKPLYVTMKHLVPAFLLLCSLTWAEPPLQWQQPESFQPKQPGLGLPPFPKLQIQDLYAPQRSAAALCEGGSGAYESVLHGTYNHHQQVVVVDQTIIVYWTNHIQDENGAGQRVLARTGTFSSDGSHIDWNAPEDITVLTPPAMPADRRTYDDSASVVTNAATIGSLSLVEGRLFMRGMVFCCQGWTDTPQYHKQNTSPVPDEHFSPKRDRNFRFDIFWRLANFIQEWGIDNGRLRPLSPLYWHGHGVAPELQLTPTIHKPLAPLLEPYRSARPLSEAPAEFQKAWRGPETVFLRTPKYAPNTNTIAADGLNGLSHYTEYHRPDGSWVVVRDNLLATQTYYAALKKNADDFYPPAEKTNLFGTAMPVAGELPDGSVWLIGSDAPRQNAYLTWSRDGIRFDHTWLLLHLRYEATPGICKGPLGGAQYFKSIPRGNYLWVVYSVAKEKVGILRLAAEDFPH